jgi:hypothetical protein
MCRFITVYAQLPGKTISFISGSVAWAALSILEISAVRSNVIE